MEKVLSECLLEIERSNTDSLHNKPGGYPEDDGSRGAVNLEDCPTASTLEMLDQFSEEAGVLEKSSQDSHPPGFSNSFFLSPPPLLFFTVYFLQERESRRPGPGGNKKQPHPPPLRILPMKKAIFPTKTKQFKHHPPPKVDKSILVFLLTSFSSSTVPSLSSSPSSESESETENQGILFPGSVRRIAYCFRGGVPQCEHCIKLLKGMENKDPEAGRKSRGCGWTPPKIKAARRKL